MTGVSVRLSIRYHTRESGSISSREKDQSVREPDWIEGMQTKFMTIKPTTMKKTAGPGPITL